MHWPIQPVEIQRHFAPPFCPRQDCSQHEITSPRRFVYQRYGSFVRKDGRRVPRYRCDSCRHTFSKQAFALSYFLKRPELLEPVASGLVNGAAHRQIARLVGCAPSTVTRLSARLGRHGLLLQVLALSHLGEDREPMILDHFESFEGTQDAPIAIATLVGSESWFCYGLEGSTHERTGRRSVYQERRRKRRDKRARRGGYRGSTQRLLETRLGFLAEKGPLQVAVDDKLEYAQAVTSRTLRGRIDLRVFPNPERGPKGAPRSEVAVARDAAMFANDLFHALMRHSMAHHHRETIAFPRRINAALERVFIMMAWRNFVKGVSERKHDPTTPAMTKGLATLPWSWARVLARRLFPKRLPVPQSWMELYRRSWTTPGIGTNARHELALGF